LVNAIAGNHAQQAQGVKMSDVTTTVVGAPTSPVEGIKESQIDAANIEAAPEPEPKKDFLAPKFAALSRKEKEVREKERAIKAQLAEFEKQRSEFESKSKSAADGESALLAEMRKNPLKFMEKHGLTFEQLTEMQLNDQNPTMEMQMAQMRAELKAEMEETYGKLSESLKEKEEREANEKYQAAVNGYKAEMTTFVSANPDKYELILANDATDLLLETAEAYFAETQAQGNPRVPTYEEVADAVEAHFEEQAKQILKLKKFNTAQKPEPGPSKQTAPTLSNSQSAELPKSGTKRLTDEESKREAAKLIRWFED
jgi:hypothetical protein